jgi:hypothetical protein
MRERSFFRSPTRVLDKMARRFSASRGATKPVRPARRFLIRRPPADCEWALSGLVFAPESRRENLEFRSALILASAWPGKVLRASGDQNITKDIKPA